MSKLSPTAKAVLDAALPAYDDEHLYVAIMEKHAGMIAAAAIKAITEIVAPLEYEDIWTDGKILQYEKEDPLRKTLFSIADELAGL